MIWRTEPGETLAELLERIQNNPDAGIEVLRPAVLTGWYSVELTDDCWKLTKAWRAARRRWLIAPPDGSTGYVLLAFPAEVAVRLELGRPRREASWLIRILLAARRRRAEVAQAPRDEETPDADR